MFQDNEYIGFVTYTQGKRNRKIPFGIVSQSYKQKAIVTHYSLKSATPFPKCYLHKEE